MYTFSNIFKYGLNENLKTKVYRFTASRKGENSAQHFINCSIPDDKAVLEWLKYNDLQFYIVNKGFFLDIEDVAKICGCEVDNDFIEKIGNKLILNIELDPCDSSRFINLRLTDKVGFRKVMPYADVFLDVMQGVCKNEKQYEKHPDIIYTRRGYIGTYDDLNYDGLFGLTAEEFTEVWFNILQNNKSEM